MDSTTRSRTSRKPSRPEQLMVHWLEIFGPLAETDWHYAARVVELLNALESCRRYDLDRADRRKAEARTSGSSDLLKTIVAELKETTE